MSIGGFHPIMPSQAQDAKAHERKLESAEKAAQAQGIEGDDKESAASSEDRDADGRQAWRWFQQQQGRQEEKKEHQVPDLSGQSGKTLDLSG